MTITRRRFTAATIALGAQAAAIQRLAAQDVESGTMASPVASPMASPVAAGEPAPMMDDVLPDYGAAESTLLDQGRAFMSALRDRDDAALQELMSPEMSTTLGEEPSAEVMDSLEKNQVLMDFPEVAATFRGNFTPEAISGFYYQLGSVIFQLVPEESQSGDVPTGVWNGHIGGEAGLPITIEFSGTAAELEALISIPSQNLQEHPLSNVAFETEMPLGEQTQERALLVGQGQYGAAWEWSGVELVMNAAFDADGVAIGLAPEMHMPLPEDPAAESAAGTEFRLPFEGTWLVIWGGDTEFLNYHAPVPSQRHAYDLLVWKDGATFEGDGTRNSQYFAWGQEVLSPVGGTVVEVLDGLEDVPPNAIADPTMAAELDPTAHPAGNHVVVETDAGEYLLLAHFQQETVAVANGDQVSTGDLLGLCGSSGNSSEPHIHIHLQDAPDMLQPATIGLPLAFTGLDVDGEFVESAPLVQGQLVAPAEE